MDVPALKSAPSYGKDRSKRRRALRKASGRGGARPPARGPPETGQNWTRGAAESGWVGRGPLSVGHRIHHHLAVDDTAHFGRLSASRGLLQFLIAEALQVGRLGADQLSPGDRKACPPSNRYGVGPLGPELFLEGGVLADGFEKLGEVLLGHGSFYCAYG